MPKHIAPFSSFVTLGWQILVLKPRRGGLNGYSLGRTISMLKAPPAYTLSGGPDTLACQTLKSPSFGRVMVTPSGGLDWTSPSSFMIRLLVDILLWMRTVWVQLSVIWNGG